MKPISLRSPRNCFLMSSTMTKVCLDRKWSLMYSRSALEPHPLAKRQPSKALSRVRWSDRARAKARLASSAMSRLILIGWFWVDSVVLVGRLLWSA